MSFLQAKLRPTKSRHKFNFFNDLWNDYDSGRYLVQKDSHAKKESAAILADTAIMRAVFVEKLSG